jgi:hypothetical protein
MATNEDAATREVESAETPERDATEASGQSPSGVLQLKAMWRAATRLFANWRALILLLILYSALIAALYFFIAVREARVWQVFLTFLLALVAPILFFIIQAVGTRYVERDAGARELFVWAARNFWKLLVVTVPVLLLAWLVAYLFGKFQMDATAAVAEAGRTVGAEAEAARPAAARAAVDLFSWKEVILSTLRFLTLYLILPLVAIHLWIAAARHGMGGAFRNVKDVLASALRPGSVLVYFLGLLLFGVIPYLLITVNFFVGGTWREIIVLGVRLALAALFILFGWLITLGALSILSREEQG